MAAVIAFEGPVGVGKTSLGREVAAQLRLGFVDGDDHCAPGPWFRSSLETSRGVAAACEALLRRHPAVILAYPMRRTNWLFYHETFRRRGIAFHCISLTADLAHIAGRDRVLSKTELQRSAEMHAQGYGARAFSDLVMRTDAAGFDETRDRLVAEVGRLIARQGT